MNDTKLRYSNRKKTVMYCCVAALLISLIIGTIITNALQSDILLAKWRLANIFNKVAFIMVEYFIIDYILIFNLNNCKCTADIRHIYKLCQPVLLLYILSISARAIVTLIHHPGEDSFAFLPFVIPAIALILILCEIQAKHAKPKAGYIIAAVVFAVLTVLALIAEVMLWINV